MKETIEEKRIGDYLIEIFPYECPESPREWCNLGIMVCLHSRYDLGDNHEYSRSDYNSWEELKKQIEQDFNVGVILPLYLYDHSGITISTSPFSCSWDSGQVGWIFCTKEDMDSEWIGLSGQEKEERSEVLLEGEVETYDQYLRGDIYGYKISKVSTCDHGHEHKEEVESIWGFYGQEDCMKEAEDMVQWYIKKETEKVS
jgi:hypothetical protein